MKLYIVEKQIKIYLNLEFHGPVNTVMVISNWSVNLFIFFLGRLSALSG